MEKVQVWNIMLWGNWLKSFCFSIYWLKKLFFFWSIKQTLICSFLLLLNIISEQIGIQSVWREWERTELCVSRLLPLLQQWIALLSMTSRCFPLKQRIFGRRNSVKLIVSVLFLIVCSRKLMNEWMDIGRFYLMGEMTKAKEKFIRILQ